MSPNDEMLSSLKNALWHEGGAREKQKLLDFIENNTKKADFITWLDTQHKKSFAEQDEWESIKRVVAFDNSISLSDLRLYATSLSSEKDVAMQLAEVEQKTDKAERAAARLLFLSASKKFSVAIGGASVMIGLLFLLAAIAVFFNILEIGLPPETKRFIFSTSALIGIVNLLAGLLLSVR